MKGEDGREMFEEGVVLARQFLNKGDWLVWDLRPDTAKSCKECSSYAERLVRHEHGTRCPKGVVRNSVGEARGLLAQEAIAERAVRMAIARAPEPASGEDGGEAAFEQDVEEEEEGEAVHQECAELEPEVCNPRTVLHAKVLFLVCDCF